MISSLSELQEVITTCGGIHSVPTECDGSLQHSLPVWLLWCGWEIFWLIFWSNLANRDANSSALVTIDAGNRLHVGKSFKSFIYPLLFFFFCSRGTSELLFLPVFTQWYWSKYFIVSNTEWVGWQLPVEMTSQQAEPQIFNLDQLTKLNEDTNIRLGAWGGGGWIAFWPALVQRQW